MAHEHTPSSALPAAGSEVHGRTLATNLLLALRPGQWTKNLLVFAGLLFSMKLFEPVAVVRAIDVMARPRAATRAQRRAVLRSRLIVM